MGAFLPVNTVLALSADGIIIAKTRRNPTMPMKRIAALLLALAMTLTLLGCG